jgi:hypothetical protein
MEKEKGKEDHDSLYTTCKTDLRESRQEELSYLQLSMAIKNTKEHAGFKYDQQLKGGLEKTAGHYILHKLLAHRTDLLAECG